MSDELNDAALMFDLVIYFDADEAEWTARCSEIPACYGADEDREQAIKKARAAISEHLAYLDELGLEHPKRLGRQQ